MQEILNNVKYLALRILDPEKDPVGRAMQKILRPGVFYYFYSGIDINDDTISLRPTVPQELYRIEKTKGGGIEINLCAIVGENGSGKSSIVDYIIRILNNLATYILGENYRTPKAEHLHYIPHVYAELYILIETNIFCITCCGDIIEVQPYYYNHNKRAGVFEKFDNTPYRFHGVTSKKEIIVEHSNLYDIIRKLCYTIVANYSIYAFNPENYIEESTPIKKEIEIRKIGNRYDEIKLYEDIRDEARKTGDNRELVSASSWLRGLFHRNDGYQVPIVLTPFRLNGTINMQIESSLAKERLLSLVFMYDSVSGERLFSTINRKLIINGFSLKADQYNNSNFKNTHKRLQEFMSELTSTGYNELYQYIKQLVSHEFKISKQQDIVLENEAWNYIITKIIKITFTYSKYALIRESLRAIKDHLSDDDKYNIEQHLFNLWKDHSHVTRKLYRTIYYLHFNFIGKRRVFSIDDYLKVIQPKVGRHMYSEIFNPPYCIDELLPPPIFDVDYLLYDINDTKFKYKIPFSTLSSGEKQITYTLTTFYYHLMNLDSRHDVAVRLGGDHLVNTIPIKTSITPTNFKYEHVTLIFDEIELYFHPEMQRTFVANLLDGIRQLNLSHIRSLQIMMVTHSPFILSDIPKSNVLFLKKDGYSIPQNGMKTFGANIHHILKNSFFLQDGTMGLFAQKTINSLIQETNFCKYCYQLNAINKSGKNEEKRKEAKLWHKMKNLMMLNSLPAKLYSKDCDEERMIEEGKILYNKNLDYWQWMSEIIEEPIIRESLKKQINEIKDYVDN
ncbi:MAG: AAA family ATPase [Bacteroidaceae bacterium]|nr:AAA family ATPase [Lachnospiraceae bacterium]MBR5841719.1 AAA family ATPase [Bacteroidaceae bacterium]